MKVHGSGKSKRSDASTELGVPVAQIVATGTKMWGVILGKAIPKAIADITGGPAEKVEKRLQKLRERQALQQKVNVAESNIRQLRDRLKREMTPEKAAQVLQNDGEFQRTRAYSEWSEKLSHLPRTEEAAQSIAEAVRQTWLDVANDKALKAAAPQMIGSAAGLIGAAGIAYSMYKNRVEDQE